MSVLIRGMTMPKSCENCAYQAKGACFALGVNKGMITIRRMGKDRPDWCPVAEIKMPHGDLIDRDDIRNAVFEHLRIKGEKNLLPAEKSVFGQIIKAKAVVEAEGE